MTRILNVSITATTLTEELEEHPDYPSLLSVSDVLANYGINNISLSFKPEKLTSVPVPFITQIKGIKDNLDFFTIVKAIDSEEICFFDPEDHKWVIKRTPEFLSRCSNIVLLTEVGYGAGDKDFKVKEKEEKRRSIVNSVTGLALPIFALLIALNWIVVGGTEAIPSFLYILLTMCGTAAGMLLIWYEHDQHNPLLRQICSTGSKVNCGAVLQSSGAKIYGIPWSRIGFSYFAGLVMTMLFEGGMNQNTLAIISWINILALPYIFYSIYYQGYVIKQWCVLCLIVQVTLFLQFIVSASAGWLSLSLLGVLKTETVLHLLMFFSIPFVTLSIFLPALNAKKEKKNLSIELQRLKQNPIVFEAMLSKQRSINIDPSGLGITLGNRNASRKLIKVCSPYCNPCAKAHIPMEALLNNNDDLQIQIIFTASLNESDIKRKPVSHLLAIANGFNDDTIKGALDDWYLAEKKDYAAFALKYPMNGELAKQEEKIRAMWEWCEESEIEYTPTFFLSGNSVNGIPSTTYYELPLLYSVADLKYFLSV
ncbi:vitamin K epoxide reductase family protein [Mucilaginibacter sp. SJ]|uniref:vitamin K epoxide reductase family protein n=1 Tax=Mucilaginibacter sp. SJ TaxID=3029053 RepID=UPI0023A93D98|nr:vitamin K epoxide reductase family protein [Mucilaginibacter sp. SJ]WEA01822.1 vitamin K epoxide reductase family protein [Mucilaginibacter sp. SJ]